MPSISTAWKTDNYKFVGKSFEMAYADRRNKLAPIIGEVTTNSVDYEIEGAGGYGVLPEYDGVNLNVNTMKRGFKTIVTPTEKLGSVQIGYKAWKNDQHGECKKAGKRLGESANMTILLKQYELFSGAFDANGQKGGDGKTWAATDHPLASKGSEGRTFVADTDAGTFSNLFTKELSVANIEALQAAGAALLTPDGLPFLAQYDTLLVSASDEALAKKICGEHAKLYATEVGNMNPLENEMNYIVVGNGSFGFKKGQWAICDKRIMKEVVQCVFNTKPMVVQNTLDNPFIDMYTAYVDFSLGWGDARQILFSKH